MMNKFNINFSIKYCSEFQYLQFSKSEAFKFFLNALTFPVLTYYRVRSVITKLNSRILQYIPGWIELNFQDFSDVVYHVALLCSQLLILAFSVATEHLVHINVL